MTTPARTETLPFYLRDNYAPVEKEVTAFDLTVEGAIPTELRGLYLRNGPNPKREGPGHWFFGDGMVHGVRLEGGKAAWYRNRWVRTRALEENAEWMRPDGSVDLTVAVANTNVICHARRILALVENAFPTELTPELDTVGIHDFEGRLRTPMTAHPKLCPRTGEMHFFGYFFAPPYLTYHRADRDGKLVQSEAIEVPGPTMMHDFAITERRILFMDLPIVFDLELAMKGTMPYRWSDDYTARVGVMPRGGSSADVRWFEVEPCYVFHPLNAYDDGERVVMDVARYPELWRQGPQRFDPAYLHRWTLDLEANKVIEQRLDDRPVEFPRVDDRLVGSAHRYGYAVADFSAATAAPARATTQLVRYDLASGETRVNDFGPGCATGEGVFAPVSAKAGEDEGWVLCFVYDATRKGSELVILDASAFDAKPVARIRLPQRVPFGFHGSWIPDPA